MATSLLLVAFSLLGALVFSEGAGTNTTTASPQLPAPGRVCYVVRRRLCWTYGRCGFREVRRAVVVGCERDVCGPKCSRVCTNVWAKVYRRRCHRHHPWHYWSCGHVPVWVKQRKCVKKCVRKCTVVQKRCRFFRVLKFPRFCPTLKLDNETVVMGTSRKPLDIVIPNNTTAYTTNLTIIGK